jgi:hypothetical protein
MELKKSGGGEGGPDNLDRNKWRDVVKKKTGLRVEME